MKVNKFDHLEIIKLYSRYKNATKVAKIINCSITTVCRILKKNNITLVEKGSCLRTSINENYFEKIDNQDKAYWLGFLYADGCITDNNRLVIHLAIKDIGHLEKFKESLSWEGDIKCYDKSVKIAIRSNKLTNDLISHGCTPRKTFTLTFPNLDKDLIPHFIRGYFDGDGSVFISNEKHWRNDKISPIIHCRFIGTKTLIENIASEIGYPLTTVKKCKKVIISDNIYLLEIKRNPRSLMLMKFLYKDSNLYLERKKEVFDKYFNTEMFRDYNHLS